MMMQVSVPIHPGENYTGSALMKRYAEQIGAEYVNSMYGGAEVIVKGIAYRYHAAKDNGTTAALYLAESRRYQKLNGMCRSCPGLVKGCPGTTVKAWTGCALKGGYIK